MAANADEAAATAKTVTLNGTEYPCLVEGEPECDVVVLGTGLKEMILTGVFQHKGLKVLVLDRNGYYGGSTASMNLEQIFEKFRGEKYDREAYKAKTGNDLGASRDYMLE